MWKLLTGTLPPARNVRHERKATDVPGIMITAIRGTVNRNNIASLDDILMSMKSTVSAKVAKSIADPIKAMISIQILLPFCFIYILLV